jgi:hypothetical protein
MEITRKYRAEIWKKYPGERTMHVAKTVLPDGPLHEKLQPGDVLIKFIGSFVNFDDLEVILDKR